MSPLPDIHDILSYATGNSSISSSGNFAPVEAYDENLEDIHASLSRRGAIRSTLNANKSSKGPSAKYTPRENVDIDYTDIKNSIRSSTHSTRSSNAPLSRGNSISDSIGEEREKKGKGERSHRSSDKKSSHSSRSRKRSTADSCASTVASGVSTLSKEDSVNKDRSRSGRRNQRTTESSEGRRVRSNSEIKRLLECDDYTNKTDKDKDKDKLIKSPSKSRSGGKSVSGRTKSRERKVSGPRERSPRRKPSQSRERSPRRKPSRSRERSPRRKPSRSPTRKVARSPTRKVARSVSDAQSSPKFDKDNRRRDNGRPRSASQEPYQSNLLNRRRGVERKKGDNRKLDTASLHSMRTYQRRLEQEKEEERARRGETDDDFEKAWASRTSPGESGELDPTLSPNFHYASENDGSKDYSSNGDFHPTESGKKTKLEKIHELQAKCDRYKTELKKMADDRVKYRRKIDDSREEVVSLKKIVEEYEVEFTRLQTKLADVQDELEMTRTEQRTERSELSDAAKELARVNIDYAKSVDEVRSVKAELDIMKETLADREKKVTTFEEELRKCQENVKHFEADVLYADEQIDKLESENRHLEIELTAYREAVDRDSGSNTDGVGNGDNMRKAKEEAERRKLEEREKIMDEKSKALDDQMNEFETKKKVYLEEEKRKEQEFEEKQARQEERLNIADQERLRKEEEISKIQKTLEDENTALKGKLKSEQLDSTRKLQNKDEAIKQLQQEIARMTIRSIHDSARDNSSALQHEIETLKADAAKTKIDFEDAHMKNIELQNEVNDLEIGSREMKKLIKTLEEELIDQRKEVENQKRKTLEWQKKSGEWSDKAFKWKEMCEHWEKRARDSNNDSINSFDEDAVQTDPQALFLAAAVEKKAVHVSASNSNGSWHLRRLFGQGSENEDENQGQVEKLEAENSMKETEIKKLKSEMVKIQTTFKEEAYSKVQEYEKLQKKKEELEQSNANLLKELELARKLNRTISGSIR
eukprot:CAMPEP_0172377554 /NCGR_PEP_ID=MMETSP1060-20121228/68966_1 /TAXON_ID=37318 /ORGANISM="Pseudo-nitzschia pungens, Strain cf. cingulata" /LENGTH=989 /DNA_ID=CAMNT_0013105247 /DNA_START=210 /DNA_END=3179 /DNA_ORIENTATION=+